MLGESPFAAGPTAGPRPRDKPFSHFGDYINRPFQVYFAGQRWQDWLVPMLVCAAVGVVAMLCCYVPLLLVMGPLTCGLHVCGLRTLRGQQFDAGTLWRGWGVTGTAILASLVIQFLMLLPLLLIYALAMGAFLLVIPVLGGPGPPGPAGGPQGAEVAMVFVGMIGWWVLMMLGCVAGMLWTWWLATRTMFVMPLVADRELDFSTAWSMSWQETRHGFWELLLLNVLAGIIGMLGIYVCYVGAIVSIPLGVMIVDAAYEGRFAPEAELLE